MTEIYLLAMVVAAASLLAIFISRFKIPILVSFVATGAILSAFHIIQPSELEFLSFIPEIGLAFLLFLVGMELDLAEFRKLGRNVLVATGVQIGLSIAVLGSFLAFFIQPWTSGLFLGAIVGLSSTILVIKLLVEQKELSSLHGRLSVGILLVEDLLAVLILVGLSVFSAGGGQNPGWLLIGVIFKAVVLMWISLLAGKRVLPRILSFSAENPELLLITAVSWCLLFVSLSLAMGFSLAIGAFLAGVSLAQSVYRIQISGRVRPLRDFFIMLFFLDLGTGLSISGLLPGLGIALVILAYSVIVKPIIYFLTFSLLRLKTHSAFLAGAYISSISEFSLIIFAMASKQGLIDKSLLSPLIFATVASFIFSAVFITHRNRIYLPLKDLLKKTQRAQTIGSASKGEKELNRHAVLIGCHRSGEIILKTLEKKYGENLVVLDFNPEVVERLKSQAINCIYGDVSDPEVMESLQLERARIVISTVRDQVDNLALLDHLEKIQSPAVVIMTASEVGEAIRLYERGAHHVSLPMNLEGNSIGRLVHDYHEVPVELAREKDRKLGELKKLQF